MVDLSLRAQIRPYFTHIGNMNDANVSSFIEISDSGVENFIFNITNFKIMDGINQMPRGVIRVQLPANLFTHPTVADRGFKTSQDFWAHQQLKMISLCCKRDGPYSQDLFQESTYWHGLIASARVEYKGGAGDVATIELVSPLELLSRRNHYRSFGDESPQPIRDLQAILEKIFAPYREVFADKFEITYKLSAEQRPRMQTLQMGETDLEFLQRIMEENGLSFFFYYTEKKCHLVITATVVSSLKDVEGQAFGLYAPDRDGNNTKALSFFALNDFSRRQGVPFSALEVPPLPLMNYQVVFRPALSNVSVLGSHDYRFLRPLQADSSQDESQQSPAGLPLNVVELMTTTHVPLPEKDEGAARVATEDAQNYLQFMADARRRRDVSLKDLSSAYFQIRGFMSLCRSCIVKIGGEAGPHTGAFEKNVEYHYFPARIVHYFQDPRYASSADPRAVPYFVPSGLSIEISFFDAKDSHNPKLDNNAFMPSFEPLPQSFAFSGHLAKRTPRAFLAVVVPFKKDDDTSNSYVLPNTVRIRFPWQTKEESVRARVTFPWTGNNYGYFHILEPDSEVLVTFADGAPDQPIVVGSLYNAATQYPIENEDAEKRDPNGPFGDCGIVFREDKARIVFGNQKDTKSGKPGNQKDAKSDKAVPVLNFVTDEGDLRVVAANMDINVQKSSTTKVGSTDAAADKKSVLTMDEGSIGMVIGESNLNMTKDEMGLDAKAIKLKAKSDINGDASTIQLNSLRLPKSS